MSATPSRTPLVPAQAGTQPLDCRFRGNERNSAPLDWRVH